ncbi:PEP-CTERM sorting domain-containing protein [uncultured Roseobacter sp.]|uniref:PEP-CTERM sorting domain-containing protein n=1 Tax=uncultured Roseobacter sp. TaxID=114847 RepID=UPI003459462B
MKYCLTVLLSCGVCFAATDSEAATFRIEAEATISTVGSAFTGAGFATGQSASLIWEYDSNAPQSVISGSIATYFDNPTSSFSMTFNGQTYSEGAAGTSLDIVQLTDGTAGDPIFTDDLINVGGQGTPVTFAGVADMQAQIRLEGSSGLLSGTDLSQIPDFDELDFSTSSFRLVGGGGVDKNLTARITSATFTDLSAVPDPSQVPVPAALPLLLGGMGLFGALKLRRKTGA